MKYISSNKLLIDKRKSKKNSYPLLFSSEGIDKVGNLVAYIYDKGVRSDFYYKDGILHSISYFKGLRSYHKIFIFKILGHILQLLPFDEVNKYGNELLIEIKEMMKSEVDLGSSYRLNDSKIELSEVTNYINNYSKKHLKKEYKIIFTKQFNWQEE